MPARAGPVGDEDRQVVLETIRCTVVAISQPDRESQVVANLRQDAPAFQFNQQAILAADVALVLVGHAEQMAFVVDLEAAIRAHPHEAVDALVAMADHQASGNHAIDFAGKLRQPVHARAVHCFGVVQGLVGEAAQESFRQYDKIGLALQRPHQCAVVVAIAGSIVPARCTLHQGNTK